MNNIASYWDEISEAYQSLTEISTEEFHFGPLLPGDNILKIIPFNASSKRCLELGCGGAQNSIYLSKHGASCTALDISERQIAYALDLAKKENQKIDLLCTSMEEPEGLKGEFDFVHSVYALPFSENPGKVFQTASDFLVEGGVFLLAAPHPLMQTDTLEVDGEFGIFIPDYFNPPTDIRFDE